MYDSRFPQSPQSRITYELGASSLGTVLVAETDDGVCAVLLGERAEELIDDLGRRFVSSEVLPAESDGLLDEVLACVEDPTRSADVSLDLHGTPFQQRVWQELRKVGPGQTASYAEIAKRLGAPRSCRAVAGAVAANPVAVIVPCHRILHADGSLSGYRWGTQRKQELLDRERRRKQ